MICKAPLSLGKHWRHSTADHVRVYNIRLFRVMGIKRFAGQYWAQKAVENSEQKGKELRKEGFALAEERYSKMLRRNIRIYHTEFPHLSGL